MKNTMKFTVRKATEDEIKLIAGDGEEQFNANMSEPMKELLTQCRKLKAGMTDMENTLSIDLSSGKVRTQLKAAIKKNSGYVKDGELELILVGDKTLSIRKKQLPKQNEQAAG